MQKGLVVDIDDTLADTTKTWIEHFQKLFGNPENYTAQEMYNKYHYVQNVPYWKKENAKRLIYELINDNTYQVFLPLIEGSNTALSDISKDVPIMCYLTKRPESVRSGTELWLKKHNFPPAKIIFKPNDINVENGNDWKSGYIKEYHSHIFGVIDDDEKLFELIEEKYYLKFFLFGRENIEQSKLDIHSCPSWSFLREKIKSLRKC